MEKGIAKISVTVINPGQKSSPTLKVLQQCFYVPNREINISSAAISTYSLLMFERSTKVTSTM